MLLRYPLAFLCAAALVICATKLPAQEPAFTLLATNTLPGGGIPGDVCFDTVANLVYVIETTTNDTVVYNRALVLVGTVPSGFPPTASVTGISADPVTGGVGWVLFDSATSNNEIWGAINVFATPVRIATIASPLGAAFFGIDIPIGIPGVIVMNDIGNGTSLATDFFGNVIFGPVVNPGGLSTGVAHMSGPFLAHNVGLTGPTGLPTTWQTTNALTGLAIDTVGVLVAGSIPGPTPFAFGFDFGPPTALGGYSMYVSEPVNNAIHQIDYHRPFLRGDVNSDGAVNIADVTALNALLTAGTPIPTCLDAADVNDDGFISTPDVTFLLAFFFGGGPPPPAPGPTACGYDPTIDGFRCDIPAGFCP